MFWVYILDCLPVECSLTVDPTLPPVGTDCVATELSDTRYLIAPGAIALPINNRLHR